jgi:hypothetical protein
LILALLRGAEALLFHVTAGVGGGSSYIWRKCVRLPLPKQKFPVRGAGYETVEILRLRLIFALRRKNQSSLRMTILKGR